jgi:hypothetical protein
MNVICIRLFAHVLCGIDHVGAKRLYNLIVNDESTPSEYILHPGIILVNC